MYGWFILLQSKNWHSSIKQLYSNWKKKKDFAIFVNVNTSYIAFYGYYELQVK